MEGFLVILSETLLKKDAQLQPSCNCLVNDNRIIY